MTTINNEIKEALKNKFNKDTLLTLATSKDNKPYARHINVYYEDGTFYFITEGSSNKMKELQLNNICCLVGDWFIAHATSRNLGYIGLKENKVLLTKLEESFSSWLNHKNINYDNHDIIIVALDLLKGNFRYDNKTYNF